MSKPFPVQNRNQLKIKPKTNVAVTSSKFHVKAKDPVILEGFEEIMETQRKLLANESKYKQTKIKFPQDDMSHYLQTDEDLDLEDKMYSKKPKPKAQLVSIKK